MTDPKSIHGNQGEGNREADRRYREAAKKFSESGKVDEAAEEARREVETGEDPADEPEDKGKL
jgi:hypothetical protein